MLLHNDTTLMNADERTDDPCLVHKNHQGRLALQHIRRVVHQTAQFCHPKHGETESVHHPAVLVLNGVQSAPFTLRT